MALQLSGGWWHNYSTKTRLSICLCLCWQHQSSWSKGISETKSKQQSPCSNCMHRPVTSWPTVGSHHRDRTYENKKNVHVVPILSPLCRCAITGRSHALTAWDLKFQVCLGYTFTTSYFGQHMEHSGPFTHFQIWILAGNGGTQWCAVQGYLFVWPYEALEVKENLKNWFPGAILKNFLRT